MKYACDGPDDPGESPVKGKETDDQINACYDGPVNLNYCLSGLALISDGLYVLFIIGSADGVDIVKLQKLFESAVDLG